MFNASKVKKATQSVIPVTGYHLQVAILSEGNKPVRILKDKKGNIWLLFKNDFEVRRTIERYHLGTLRVDPHMYEHYSVLIGIPPYWFE